MVIGPRQIGKTTALKQALNGRGMYFSADYPAPLPAGMLEQWWQAALGSADRILAIDEIQKVSQWSEMIKQLWDQNPGSLKVVLTGSSALLMEKGLQESLAGRFELIRAEHWNFFEAADVFAMSMEGHYPPFNLIWKYWVSLFWSAQFTNFPAQV